MKDKSIYIIVAVALAAVVALSTGFRAVPLSENPWARGWRINYGPIVAPSTPSARERTIETEGAERAEVTITQEVGVLDVTAGGSALMDAEFDTNRSDWIPDVTYDVEGTTGVLSVVQHDSDGWTPRGNRNNWNIELSRSLPLELHVERGIGEGEIDLSELDVRTFEATLGMGDTTIDLTGPRSNDMRVSIEGGIGRAKLVIPSSVGVRIYAEKGLGEIKLPDGLTTSGGYWTNEAYGEDGPKIDIRMMQGIGEIDVEME